MSNHVPHSRHLRDEHLDLPHLGGCQEAPGNHLSVLEDQREAQEDHRGRGQEGRECIRYLREEGARRGDDGLAERTAPLQYRQHQGPPCQAVHERGVCGDLFHEPLRVLSGEQRRVGGAVREEGGPCRVQGHHIPGHALDRNLREGTREMERRGPGQANQGTFQTQQGDRGVQDLRFRIGCREQR